VLKRFFKSEVSAPDEKSVLMIQMKEALEGYKRARHAYEMHLAFTEDSGDATGEILYAQLEMYRRFYFILRVQYEKQYGDIFEYETKLKQFNEWKGEQDLCLQKSYNIHTPSLFLVK
jgi:hypothetical protein